MLQQILLFETEFQEWIERDDDLLPPHSDDSVSNDAVVIDEPKLNYEEAWSRIRNYNFFSEKLFMYLFLFILTDAINV